MPSADALIRIRRGTFPFGPGIHVWIGRLKMTAIFCLFGGMLRVGLEVVPQFRSIRLSLLLVDVHVGWVRGR